MVGRGEVWLVTLDPTVGSEIKKTRPCVVVSPPELHDFMRTAIIAPLTTAGRAAPFRLLLEFQGKRGFILLDQIRAVDKTRLVKRVGSLSPTILGATLRTLCELFAP